MKLVLNVICWIAAAFCFVFPFTYFQSDMDKQEVKVSHILVDNKEKADELRTQIINKEKTLEELAEKYSKCSSKTEKGSLKFAPRGTYVPEFEKVAFTQEVGVISEPIQTEYGWHIVRVDEIKYFSDKVNFSRRYK